ncbi:MAG: acetyl-CoA decarbonylase/synthase complex subunit gamma [Candidatus Syntropharchaeia archaeon]
MRVSGPLDIYNLLPRTNCDECGRKTCMAFATELIERTVKLEDCKPLLKEEKYKKAYEKLVDILRPEIKQVELGTGDKILKLGGEDVLHRHDLTFYNKCALAYDVWDTMDEKDLVERVNAIQNWRKFYVGDFLTLDAIAVRSVSGDPNKFFACVKKVSETTDLPLVLCSFDPKVIESGLEVVSDKNPLIYAATKQNWREVADLVDKYKVPVVLSSPDDLDGLKSLAVTFSEIGIEDLVLDPGTFPTGKGLQRTFSNFVRIRNAGILESQRDIGFPMISIPMTAWMVYKDPVEAAYWEAAVAATFIIKYADIMILHSIEPYSLMTITTLDNNIYTDPRRPVAVDPGMREIGKPDENSPVFITANFALTYYTVESDLSSAGIDCYLVAVNTDGIGVESAVAGGQFTAQRVKEDLEATGLGEKVKHKTMIIPGLAARISGETEDETGWKVLVGPTDSGRIPGWMKKNWPPK